jgi:hypothetical protein
VAYEVHQPARFYICVLVPKTETVPFLRNTYVYLPDYTLSRAASFLEWLFVCHSGRLISIPRPVLVECVWWTKWHWDSCLGFLVSVSPHHCSVLAFCSYLCHCTVVVDDSVV